MSTTDLTPKQRHLRAVAAAKSRHRPEEAAAARAEYRSARVEDQIARLIADAPPLTEAQRTRLGTLLARPRALSDDAA